MTTENERTVTIAGAGKHAKTMLTHHTGVGGVKDAIIQFTKVNDYTTFDSEWAMVDDNIVFHFFMPTSHRVTEPYWLEVFAAALNEVAQSHFDATLPRLQAKYTEEVKSWWFKAQGYGHILDLPAYIDKFLESLDAKLDQPFDAMSQPKMLQRTSHE